MSKRTPENSIALLFRIGHEEITRVREENYALEDRLETLCGVIFAARRLHFPNSLAAHGDRLCHECRQEMPCPTMVALTESTCSSVWP